MAFALLAGASLLRADDDALEALEERAMKAAVAEVAPAVVRIETFGGLEKVGKALVGTGPTTGLVVDQDGYVLSSAFNFIQNPSSILVTMPDGKRAAAEIVSRDRSRMLVLLKVDTDQKLPVPTFASRDDMQVGQWTMAVGKTYDKSRPNISVGILSAVNRIWGKAIQTDAKISPSNYGGPLVDIRGRVLGLLVPLSPQSNSEVAGAEWYDSGIGFAIPVTDILPHLSHMKEGNELYPGLMGVTLKAGDIYGQAAEVISVQVKSPAREAGLQAGDVIVQADGMKVARQAQLKHILGRKYAGDSLALVVRRGEEEIEASLQLTDKLEPYEHPFLGVLPVRNRTEAGIEVHYVYPGSAAEQAEIQAGDILVKLDDKELTDVARAQEILAAYEPGTEVQVVARRGEEEREVKIRLTSLPTEIPEQIPARAKDPADLEDGGNEVDASDVVEIRLPEQENKCVAIVPRNYSEDKEYGLVVWLSAPEELDEAKLVKQWRARCEQHDLILLAPQPADAKRWQATDVEFIRKTMDEVVKDYRVDRTRVVVHGYQAGGAIAFVTTFGNRDLVRGVAAVGATVPARTRPPANDPAQRLAIYMANASKSRLAARNQAVVKALREMRYPVVTREAEKYLSEEQVDELLRWVDSLDRI
ncbi:MAG: hypothetical protein CL681_27405 [Blastopirellula sp.]|nr:hypothetical protein [Blastopirellula sp.]